jgi:DNA-binding transcriptional ArsR family regulator
MNQSGHRIAEIARMLADPARAAMLIRLLDGSARSASELARAADIAPSTASEHFRLLTSLQLVAARKQGRMRLYRIANDEVAQAIEVLGAIANRSARRAADRRPGPGDPLREARTCYSHVAGRLGVGIARALARQEFLHAVDAMPALTERGAEALSRSGLFGERVDPAMMIAKPCLDWTEREHHLAGPFGRALLERLLQCRWVVRSSPHRALRITPKGAAGLRQLGVF